MPAMIAWLCKTAWALFFSDSVPVAVFGFLGGRKWLVCCSGVCACVGVNGVRAHPCCFWLCGMIVASYLVFLHVCRCACVGRAATAVMFSQHVSFGLVVAACLLLPRCLSLIHPVLQLCSVQQGCGCLAALYDVLAFVCCTLLDAAGDIPMRPPACPGSFVVGWRDR